MYIYVSEHGTERHSNRYNSLCAIKNDFMMENNDYDDDRRYTGKQEYIIRFFRFICDINK